MSTPSAIEVPSRRQRIEGGIWGLLVGDALGVPYEFHPPEALPPRLGIGMVPPVGFDRAHRGVPPGTWSDDGAQALCLLESLLECDGPDPLDLMRRLDRWDRCGHLAVDGVVFDIGNATAQAIEKFRRGTSWERCGGDLPGSNGNGSLMRTLPLALWHRGSDAELVHDAMLLSLPTHAHARSRLSCALYCLWARKVLEGIEKPWEQAVATLESLFGTDSDEGGELRREILPAMSRQGQGSGYVVDCLASARSVLGAASWSDVALDAIALGQDTDTTACVAGGIAGVLHGVEAIPRVWRDALRGQDLFLPLLDRLLAKVL